MNITIGGMGNGTIAGIMQNAQISTSESQKQAKEETDIKQSQMNYDYVSADGDTLQISEAGKSASKGNEDQADSGNTDAKSSFAGSSTKGLENIDVSTSTNTSTSSTSSTADLSSYSESELKKMYLNGEITKAQYDEEISSRDTNE